MVGHQTCGTLLRLEVGKAIELLRVELLQTISSCLCEYRSGVKGKNLGMNLGYDLLITALEASTLSQEVDL